MIAPPLRLIDVLLIHDYNTCPLSHMTRLRRDGNAHSLWRLFAAATWLATMRTESTSTKLVSFDASAAALDGNARGFPLGYFCIRSLATGKLLDVPNTETKDGQEIILWNEKENSLVESESSRVYDKALSYQSALFTGLRSSEADNQVFFIDESGALCGKHSGHAVDVEGMLYSARPILF